MRRQRTAWEPGRSSKSSPAGAMTTYASTQMNKQSVQPKAGYYNLLCVILTITANCRQLVSRRARARKIARDAPRSRPSCLRHSGARASDGLAVDGRWRRDCDGCTAQHELCCDERHAGCDRGGWQGRHCDASRSDAWAARAAAARPVRARVVAREGVVRAGARPAARAADRPAPSWFYIDNQNCKLLVGDLGVRRGRWNPSSLIARCVQESVMCALVCATRSQQHD
jgi:hypothetical protein